MMLASFPGGMQFVGLPGLHPKGFPPVSPLGISRQPQAQVWNPALLQQPNPAQPPVPGEPPLQGSTSQLPAANCCFPLPCGSLPGPFYLGAGRSVAPMSLVCGLLPCGITRNPPQSLISPPQNSELQGKIGILGLNPIGGAAEL